MNARTVLAQRLEQARDRYGNEVSVPADLLGRLLEQTQGTVHLTLDEAAAVEVVLNQTARLRTRPHNLDETLALVRQRIDAAR